MHFWCNLSKSLKFWWEGGDDFVCLFVFEQTQKIVYGLLFQPHSKTCTKDKIITTSLEKKTNYTVKL